MCAAKLCSLLCSRWSQITGRHGVDVKAPSHLRSCCCTEYHQWCETIISTAISLMWYCLIILYTFYHMLYFVIHKDPLKNCYIISKNNKPKEKCASDCRLVHLRAGTYHYRKTEELVEHTVTFNSFNVMQPDWCHGRAPVSSSESTKERRMNGYSKQSVFT